MCPPGSFKADVGNAACRKCFPNESSTEGATKCLCKAGTFRSASSCTPCPTGTFKGADLNDGECSACPAFSETTFAGATQMAQCACLAGYSPMAVTDGWQCTPCAAGTFKNTTGDAPCDGCGAFQSTTGKAAASAT